jgi:NitT/TauT family transport system ATP-binding protein
MEWRSALENATLGLEILGYDNAKRAEIGRRWLKEVGLQGYEHAYPHQLSGGMRQRVAISRAFSVDPEILLCDEAFGHLDKVTAEHLRRAFRRLVEQTGKTALVITHDISEALDLGHRIIVLDRPAHVLYEAPTPDFSSLDERRDFEDKIFKIIDQAPAP